MRSAFLDWKPDSRAGNDHKVTLVPDTPATYKNPVSGATVDLSCNETVTVKCLQQLYNAVGYVPKIPRRENSIGVTGFLEQYANIEDLNTFYADQVPQAVGTSFEFISVNGERPRPCVEPWAIEFWLKVARTARTRANPGLKPRSIPNLLTGWLIPFLVFSGPHVVLLLSPLMQSTLRTETRFVGVLSQARVFG